jgi:MoxR-like ATPase
VDLSDVLLLKDCLWNHQENALKVRNLIVETVQRYNRLVPKTADTTTSQSSATTAKTAQKTGQLHAKERGYKGLGTAEDPILIENAQDLMGLDGIGQKGYYFRQTTDIDCTAITTWQNINLQGHYDGGGHFVQYKTGTLFQSIQAKSSVRNLELRQLNLANNVADSYIEACVTNWSLIVANATNSTITACQAGDFLIYNANRSAITACQSGSFLIRGTATDSTITDCLVAMNVSIDSNDYTGGVVHTLRSSDVVRCLVTGRVSNNYGSLGFSGITGNCDASTIRQCAIGKVELTSARWLGHIACVQNRSTLENNISIDSNSATHIVIPRDHEKSFLDGKSISPALFNQRTFEHTLGWDFNKVWQWDTQKDHPVLRSVGTGAKTATPTKPTAPQADTVDLLTQQIHANIWL